MNDFNKYDIEPVERIAPDPREDKPESGIALCLSGGGYRAMLFHLGSVWRLYELGVLKNVDRISSVSGGSITAGTLGMNWNKLSHDPSTGGDDFVANVVQPVRRLAGKTIDRTSILGGVFLPGSVSDRIEDAYNKYIFDNATLQDLPENPRFVINAMNVQSGALWRFQRPYMRDWRVGEVKNPTVSLSKAVAASSAFPPVLSPVELDLEESDFTPGSGAELQRPPYTTDVVLTDGGVYDNLGLETAWKRYDTVLVSDAGGRLKPEGEPKRDWARHAYRVLNLIDNQVRSLRKRQVIGSYVAKKRKGALWDTRMDIKEFSASGTLPCPVEKTAKLAAEPTRLKRIDDRRQEQLINWGYAITDAVVRSYYDSSLAEPTGFPYPESGV